MRLHANILPAGTLLLALSATVIAGCSRSSKEDPTMPTAREVPTTPSPKDWQDLSQLRVAFGHQSVGSEVISGITTLAGENNVRWSISETRTPLTGPGLHHFKVGKNEEPETKLNDFQTVMTAGMAESADVALVKLCYVDFDSGGNPKTLAEQYMTHIDELSARYPTTTFVAVTAPLTTVQTGPKAWIKKALGKTPSGYESNARRKVFNDALREHYAEGSQLFDIAALESGFGRTTVEYNGIQVESLDPELTYDGGHLNEKGQRRVGGALVHHLASLKRQ